MESGITLQTFAKTRRSDMGLSLLQHVEKLRQAESHFDA